MSSVRHFSSHVSRTITTTAPSSSQIKKSNRASISLYRILLKECRSISKQRLVPVASTNTAHQRQDSSSSSSQSIRLLLQPPINPRDYGRARLLKINNDETTPSSQSAHHSSSILAFLQQEISRLSHNNSTWSTNTHDYDHDYDSPNLPSDESLLTTPHAIRETIRWCFRQPSDSSSLLERHRRAIDAVRILTAQMSYHEKTSVSQDDAHGIRIMATSRCIGTTIRRHGRQSTSDGHPSYQFAYRIRVENVNETSKEKKTSVQLMGRTWEIVEGGDDGGDGEKVTVNQPRGGVVGKQPVIHPGQVFEYISGCELAAPNGRMGGYFTMAMVDDDVPSARLGDPIGVYEEDDLFRMPVSSFRLMGVSDEEDGEKEEEDDGW